jgi:DNA polymerase-3 subunit gamma/tau
MFDDQLPPPPQPVVADRRALYLRQRPRRFKDVVGQEHVTRTLTNAVKLGRPSHAYLFTGPRGTGKTSVARILYRAVNCDHLADGDPCNVCPLCDAALNNRALDLIEIDAASNRGIDDMRDLRDKVAYRPGEGRYKVYIIDEAHELTTQAWDAFLKTLEEPPPHAIFVLATTEAHKVPPTIISRCQRFDFRRIPFQATRELLGQVAQAEGMQVEPAVLERLALVARGGLRDALGLLDQLAAFAGGQVDMAVARAALSLPSIEAVRGVLDGMTRRDPSTVMAVISDAAEGGADLRLFAEELVVHLRALLMLRTGADVRLGDELPEDEVAWLRERAPAWSVGTLMRLVQTLSDALARTRDAQQFQVQTEVALLIACDVEGLAAPAAIAAAPTQPSPSPVKTESPTLQPKIAPVEEPPIRDAAPSARPAQPTSHSGDESLTSQRHVSPAAAPPTRDGTPAVHTSAPPAPANPGSDGGLALRWPDVVDQVKNRNPLFGATLGSAHPVGLQENVLIVAFATEFNLKSAEKTINRQLIETAFERVYGTAYRLRCVVGSGAEAGAGGLLDDPVINYATRTFGGQPKRVVND